MLAVTPPDGLSPLRAPETPGRGRPQGGRAAKLARNHREARLAAPNLPARSFALSPLYPPQRKGLNPFPSGGAVGEALTGLCVGPRDREHLLPSNFQVSPLGTSVAGGGRGCLGRWGANAGQSYAPLGSDHPL